MRGKDGTSTNNISTNNKKRKTIQDKYISLGFIAAGTYGRVFKAKSRTDPTLKTEYAIKKFKPDKEGDPAYQTHTTTGISQSAMREISLCRELSHQNIITLTEVLLGDFHNPQDRSIYMVFEYAEHDLLQILHYHSHQSHERKPIPEFTVKSLLWQLLNGVSYLHSNWVLHRDLKPANVLVTSDGVVKIGDLGLARGFMRPLQPLFNGDKVVVTIWYRAPELLLGSRHYTKAVDIWAVGCIFAELLILRPIFKGEEAKMDNKKNIPFQRDQLQKIFEILGFPTRERWPGIEHLPEYSNLSTFRQGPNHLRGVYFQSASSTSESGFELLSMMLEYDPFKRVPADEGLLHRYFLEEPKPGMHAFLNDGKFEYPLRRLQEDTDFYSTGNGGGGGGGGGGNAGGHNAQHKK
ncbi:cyclin-dependent protein kinase [Blyttiomyces sp. JEL0837]|nr:cyclin-dependent protein kinase [Blyttiomyces sp. JEL0837]